MNIDVSAILIVLLLSSPLIALAVFLRLKLNRESQHSGGKLQIEKLPGVQRPIVGSDNEKNRESVRKLADSIRIAFFLALVISASDLYRFMNATGEIRQGIGIALGILGTILTWLIYRELRAEKKQALSFWLAGVLLGYLRWIFIDATFDLNVISIILMLVTIAFTLRIVIWVRNGVLT